MQNFRKMGALLGAGAVIFSLAGCGGNGDTANTGSDVANAVSNNTETAGDAAANTAAAASNTVANAGEAVANTAAGVGAAVSNTAAGVGAAVSDATLTPQIKTAFAGNKGLNGSDINVDTANKTVTLTGTALSNAQKTLAGSIAKQKAAGYTIKNNLTVKAK